MTQEWVKSLLFSIMNFGKTMLVGIVEEVLKDGTFDDSPLDDLVERVSAIGVKNVEA